jgi:hypothetical protein
MAYGAMGLADLVRCGEVETASHELSPRLPSINPSTSID